MTQKAEEVYNRMPTYQDYFDQMWNADTIEEIVASFDNMLIKIAHNYRKATTECLTLRFKDWITFPQAKRCFLFFNEAVLNLYKKTKDPEGKEGNMCLVNLRKAENLVPITKYIAKEEGFDNYYMLMVYREKQLYRDYLLDILSYTPRNNINKLDEKLTAEKFLTERGYCKFFYEYEDVKEITQKTTLVKRRKYILYGVIIAIALGIFFLISYKLTLMILLIVVGIPLFIYLSLHINGDLVNGMGKTVTNGIGLFFMISHYMNKKR